MPKSSRMSRYPWWLPTRLASRIENCQVQEAHDDLERVLLRFDREHTAALSPRKLRCAAVMGLCLRGAHRGGASSEVILDQFMAGLEKLAIVRSWVSVCKFMRDYVDALLAEVRPKQTGEVERLVRSIRSEMTKSSDRVWLLKQYSNNAGLSAGYLSRKFTELTGVNFREQRKLLQMDQAKQLLTDTSLKISVISRQVGIEDCSRFIRYFKRSSGVTPAEYRKRARLKKDKTLRH